MENQEYTPMQRMIDWIEAGCSTSGENWEKWKRVMLTSEKISLLDAKSEQLIKTSKMFTNDN